MEEKSANAKRPTVKFKPENLKFLLDFMDKTGLSMKEVGESVGLSRQAVYYWFVKDDVKISNIYALFDKLGYCIDFRYERKKAKKDSSVTETVIYSRPEDRVRLGFINTAMKEFDFSKGDIAEKLELGITTVYFWFKQDDCFFSHVCSIAKVLDLKLKIEIRPLAIAKQ